MDNLQQVDFTVSSATLATNHHHHHNNNYSIDYWNDDVPSSAVLRQEINHRCNRNRLVARARHFLTSGATPGPESVVTQLHEFNGQTHGFSALFGVIHGCAGWVAHAMT